jgi:hypothetical protein
MDVRLSEQLKGSWAKQISRNFVARMGQVSQIWVNELGTLIFLA